MYDGRINPWPMMKQLLSGIGFMLNGNMVYGVMEEELSIRTGPEAYQEALSHPHIQPFAARGQPMTGWVVVTEGGSRRKASRLNGLRRGPVCGLPPWESMIRSRDVREVCIHCIWLPGGE